MSLIDNLISYWKLDGNSNDEVGSNNGADTDIVYNSGNGIINQGAGFNGTTSKIDLGQDASLALTSAGTINLWVKPDLSGLKAWYWLVDYSNITSGLNGYSVWLQFGGSTYNFWGRIGDSSSFNQVTSAFDVPSGVWTMLTFTWDGSTLKVYKNGTIDSNTTPQTINSLVSASYHLLFGRDNVSIVDNEPYNGAEDEIGIWSRALSGTEITMLYNSGVGLAYPFVKLFTLIATTGSYVFSGKSISFSNILEWIFQGKNSSTWNNQSKNNSNWTNQNKND